MAECCNPTIRENSFFEMPGFLLIGKRLLWDTVYIRLIIGDTGESLKHSRTTRKPVETPYENSSFWNLWQKTWIKLEETDGNHNLTI